MVLSEERNAGYYNEKVTKEDVFEAKQDRLAKSKKLRMVTALV
jgi:hypothetical protein